MPLIHSAIKKMRKDKKLTAHNDLIHANIKEAVKKMRQHPSDEAMKKMSSVLDKAVKIDLIKKNKAARLKSRLSKKLAVA